MIFLLGLLAALWEGVCRGIRNLIDPLHGIDPWDWETD